MQVNYALPKWQPKGPLPPKIDERTNRLFLYQERVANASKTFRWTDMFRAKAANGKSVF